MKTILFPTDFSACADRAAEYAIALAQKLNARIFLLHCRHIPVVMPSESDTVGYVPNEEDIYKEADQNLDRFIEKNFKDKNVRIEKSINFWYAADSILSTAKETNADFIVMGTTGASGMKEMLIGSIASSVAGKSSCPVLVVPQEATYAPFKKIAYATNYKDKEFEAIESLCEFARLFDAEVHILHIEDSLHADDLSRYLFDAFIEDTRKKISYKKFSFHFITGMRMAESLNAFIEDNDIEVLSLSTRKRNLFLKLFDRSLTKKMACHSHVPVLAFNLK